MYIDPWSSPFPPLLPVPHPDAARSKCFHIWRGGSPFHDGWLGAAAVASTGFYNQNLRKFSEQWFIHVTPYAENATSDMAHWGRAQLSAIHGALLYHDTCSGSSGLEQQQNGGREIKSWLLKNVWLFLLFQKISPKVNMSRDQTLVSDLHM